MTNETTYQKGFTKGDLITAEQRSPSNYLDVINNGKRFTVTRDGERREQIIKNGSLKHGKLLKGELSLSDITKTFQCNIPALLSV